jgi:hypothetical protein
VALKNTLGLLALCAAPLLAQAQSCTSPNTNGDYILGEAQGEASAMHWLTGLVWKRCSEGQTFSNGQCTGTALQKSWNAWIDTERQLLPQSFAGQNSWGINASLSQNLLASGAWRMAYLVESLGVAYNCASAPFVNPTVFPDAPSSVVWSASPVIWDQSGAWRASLLGTAGVFGYRSDGYHVRLVRAGQPFAGMPSPPAQTAAPNMLATFPAITLASSTGAGQAWGGARISGAGNPEFQLNGTGAWVTEAIVKSGDQITVRLTTPSTVGSSRSATLTLRSGQTTGTSANGANGGDESTVPHTTTASFTAKALPPAPSGARAIPTLSEWGLLLLSLLVGMLGGRQLRAAVATAKCTS